MTTPENQLLEALPRRHRLDLIAASERVDLRLSEVLGDVGRTTRYVYFPTDGFISLATTVDGKPGLEVGMIGREGMLGVHVMLGTSRAPSQAVVQGSGHAWRISTKAFRLQLASHGPLKELLDRYAAVLMRQLMASAACLRYHLVGPRLARWLLMSQDRSNLDRFTMTQAFLATMLGVRRVSITTAAGRLQEHGLIAYVRGDLTVLNRPALEQAACSCYAADCSHYAALFHSRERRQPEDI